MRSPLVTVVDRHSNLTRRGRRYLWTPPAPLPPPSAATAATNEAHDEQEQYGTDGGVEDCTPYSKGRRAMRKPTWFHTFHTDEVS